MKNIEMHTNSDNNNERSESPEIPNKRAKIDENENHRQTFQESIEDLCEQQKKQNAFMEKIMEKLEASENKEKETTEKIESILERLNEIQKNPIPEASKSDSNENRIPEVSKPHSGKCFVLKHVFKDVSELETGEGDDGDSEEHFGCPWYINIERKENHLGVFLFCEKSLKSGKWSIDTEFDVKARSKSGEMESVECEMVYGNVDNNTEINGDGEWRFLGWDELLEEFLIDDKLTVEIHVKINKTTGIYEENLRNFDQERYSDAVLVVGDRKFYVAKLFLANQSTYFDTLFLGQFQESKMTEITLSDVDPDDFQKFLEVLYGDPAIDEVTVEGILLLADMYDTQTVIEKCEDFLIEKSEKSAKKLLEMSTRYNLNGLKKKCLSEIETVDDILSILPAKLKDLDHSVMAKLLEKSLSHH